MRDIMSSKKGLRSNVPNEIPLFFKKNFKPSSVSSDTLSESSDEYREESPEPFKESNVKSSARNVRVSDSEEEEIEHNANPPVSSIDENEGQMAFIKTPY
jgi:hypothetical protein